ncbi:MAG: phosphate-starvation-inducible PsiE family protein [Bacillus sp. (in: Bacteria)]|nr:phosphate-starvation-inducible PsiE family protein [Bacillus sp. (in: firmicutes)]
MKMERAMQKFKKFIQSVSDILEQAVAVLVLVGVVFSLYSLVKDFVVFKNLLNDVSMFRGYLEDIFVIVIGLEFLQMLCRPNSDNIMEVLIFLVARHMIVSETTPYEDFVSVISIILLCVLRRYLHNTRLKDYKEDGGDSDDEPLVDD